jgi:hypothetical protein
VLDVLLPLYRRKNIVVMLGPDQDRQLVSAGEALDQPFAMLNVPSRILPSTSWLGLTRPSAADIRRRLRRVRAA